MSKKPRRKNRTSRKKPKPSSAQKKSSSVISSITQTFTGKEDLTEKELKNFKDITKSYQKFAKGHSQLSDEIASLKSIIEPVYIQSKIQEAIQQKEKEYREKIEQKDGIIVSAKNNLDDKNDEIAKLNDKYSNIKNQFEIQKGKIASQDTIINVKSQEIKDLHDENKKFVEIINKKKEEIASLTQNQQNLSVVNDDRKEKVNSIKALFPNFTNSIDVNKIEEKKFNILLEICFQISNLKEVKELKTDHNLNTEGVFDDGFQKTICVNISRIICKYGVDSLGFDFLRQDVNSHVTPYKIAKPVPISQPVDENVHNVLDGNENDLVKDYFTLTILNTDHGNAVVKKSIISSQ